MHKPGRGSPGAAGDLSKTDPDLSGRRTGDQIPGDEEEQPHKEPLAQDDEDGEQDGSQLAFGGLVNEGPISQRAVGDGRMQENDQDAHKRAQCIQVSQPRRGPHGCGRSDPSLSSGLDHR